VPTPRAGLSSCVHVLGELETLIRRINRTNAAADMGADSTITDALARRDVLRMRHSAVTATADAATGRSGAGWYASSARS
jgi:hypothetical protein